MLVSVRLSLNSARALEKLLLNRIIARRNLTKIGIMADACENAVLTHLSQSPDAVISDTFPWSEENGFDHGAVVGCIKSLEVDGYVAAESLSTSFYTLSDEAEGILANGISQEMAVFNAIVAAGSISEADLIAAVGKDIAKIGMGKCMQNKWIQKDKETKSLVPAAVAGDVKDEVVEQLQALKEGKFAEDAISSEVRPCYIFI